MKSRRSLLGAFVLGLLVGMALTAAAAWFLLGPAHARQLVVLPSAMSPPGCSAEALGREFVRWTCPISEAS